MKKSTKMKNTALRILNSKYFNIIICILMISAIIIAWHGAYLEREKLLINETTTETKILVNDVQQSLVNAEIAIDDVALYGMPSKTHKPNEWKKHVIFIVDNFTVIDSITWVGRDMKIIDFVPEKSNNTTKGELYSGNGSPAFTDLIMPVYEDENLEGFIIASLDVPSLILSIGNELLDEYSISIMRGNKQLTASDMKPDRNNRIYFTQIIESIGSNNPYKVSVAPTEEKVKSVMESSFHWLIYGLSFSIIVSILIFLAQSIYKKSSMLAQAQDELLKSKEKLEKQNEKLERHLRDEQKLETIGILASSVAHEINTPINGIMNYGQIIIDFNDTKSDTARFASEIIYETKRVSKLVNSLLQYSRHRENEYSMARPEDIVSRTTSLVNTLLKKENISLDVDIDDMLPDLLCNSQQLQQVLLNLITNARDALNEKYEGYHEDKIIKLQVKLGGKNDDMQFVRFSVKDSGNGIPKTVQERLFKQFFTTKKNDKGTGLGLYISRGIIQEHEGEMKFETKEGEYTEFSVDLPIRSNSV